MMYDVIWQWHSAILAETIHSSSKKMLFCSRQFISARPVTCFQTRSYAISVKPPKPLPGQKKPRVFKDKKAFQYNWYSRILQSSSTSPLLILHHNDFST